jgi:taurine dioxygenase
METKSLNNGAAIEVTGLDITNVSDEQIDQLRELIRQNIVVVIKKQNTDPFYFTNLSSRIGKLGNAHMLRWDVYGNYYWETRDPKNPPAWCPGDTPVQRVTGEKINGNFTGIFPTGILDWHSNLNAPTHTDGVALQGYKNCEGTSTTWLNLAKAYDEMPEDLKKRCEGVYCKYRYSFEVAAKGVPEEQANHHNSLANNYNMWLIQENRSGRKGFYFSVYNNCEMVTEDKALFDDFCDYVFQEKFMYTHYYEIGDVVLSDQLLSIHKRDQNDPAILAKRVLHRITFMVSNEGNPPWIVEYNNIG